MINSIPSQEQIDRYALRGWTYRVIFTTDWQFVKVCPYCGQVEDHSFTWFDGRILSRQGRKWWIFGNPCPTCGKIDRDNKRRTVRIVYVEITKPKKFLFWTIKKKVIDEYFEEITADGIIPLPEAHVPSF